MRTLRVADLEAKPGEKVSGFVHIIGAEFGIPVTLICGEKEGETVLISGGVHNAEYVGIQAAMQLADELDPKKIAGNIIVIRLMNRTGFEHRTMSLTYEDGKNLNRVFPGNPNGTLSDRIAYTVVTEFFPKADYYVDLHCGDGFEGLVSYVYCTGAAAPEGKVVKSDVNIAKNYLSEQEMRSLERIVSAYLDLAEDRAERHIPMMMEDWSKHLDLFLMADDREVHIGSGRCIILLCQ